MKTDAAKSQQKSHAGGYWRFGLDLRIREGRGGAVCLANGAETLNPKPDEG